MSDKESRDEKFERIKNEAEAYAQRHLEFDVDVFNQHAEKKFPGVKKEDLPYPKRKPLTKEQESELRSDFQESLLPPKPGMYAEKVATAPKAM